MSKRLGLGRYLSLSALWLWLAGCSLDSDLPGRNGSAAPVNAGVTLSGAGVRDEIDAATGYGEGSRITDIRDSSSGGSDNGSRPASADGMPGGTDSGGGAFDEGAGGIGGAASDGSGVAGAGGDAGSNAHEGNPDHPAKQPPALWFSEYVEGSSSNKALELTARTRTILDGCKVGTYFNGKTEATVVATLSGTLEAGQVLTVCTSSLQEKLKAICNQVGNLTFNGDDVVAVSCDGTILDVIGQIGVDPGDAWGSGLNTTVDHTLRRKCSVQNGDAVGTDAFNPSLEWQSFPIDTFDGLGRRGC